MSDYGFTLKVEDLSSGQIKKVEQAVRDLGGTVKRETAEINDNFHEVSNVAKDLQRSIIEAFSVYEIYNFGKELLHLTAEFQGFENVIKYSSEGIVDNAQNINYLRDAIDRLHLPMEQTFQAFSEMQAGFFGTGIEGEKLRKVFEGVAEAATVMHLSPDSFSRTTYALKEIGELGTVQMRQMRMLAMALPGSMNIAAASMGMSTQQFHEAMKKGQIQSNVFLPKFAAALTTHFSPGVGNANQSLISQMNQQKTEMIKMMLDMGEKLTPLFTDILQTVAHAFGDMRKAFDWLNSGNELVSWLKNVFDIASQLLPIWVSYEIVTALAAKATGLFAAAQEALAPALGEAAAEGEAATASMASLNAVMDTTLIGGVVTTLGLFVEHLININEQVAKLIDQQFKLSTNRTFFNTQAGTAGQMQEQYEAINKNTPKDVIQSLANSAAQFQKIQADSIGVVSGRVKKLQDDAKWEHPRSKSDRFFHGVGFAALFSNDPAQKTIDSAKTMSASLAYNSQIAQSVQKIAQGIKQKYGIAAETDQYVHGGGSGKHHAISTSNLAGANGGLGQAKIIHIAIGVVQQNNGVKETKSEAEEAVQLLIREINNMSDSQNAQ